MIKMCSFYKSSRKCINKDYCIEQLPSDENCCTSNLYYCMDLEQQNKQMREFIEKLYTIADDGQNIIKKYNDYNGKVYGLGYLQDIKDRIYNTQQALKGVE